VAGVVDKLETEPSELERFLFNDIVGWTPIPGTFGLRSSETPVAKAMASILPCSPFISSIT